jgi:hypothetical protein
MVNWTGRDVDNCAYKAQLLGVSLMEASQYIVPMLTSHKEDMETLRQSAHGRYLSASHPGVYEYTKPAEWKHTPTVKISEGRKMR